MWTVILFCYGTSMVVFESPDADAAKHQLELINSGQTEAACKAALKEKK